MAQRSSEVGKFKSEAQEADWYASPEGRRQTQREFSRALRDGTLRPSAGRKITKTDAKVLRQLVEQAKESASRAISIRIPVADLERAKRIAQETGVGYQTVLKQAIREGLKKAG
jgi:predicted DNA binding CopG/RHH family protein